MGPARNASEDRERRYYGVRWKDLSCCRKGSLVVVSIPTGAHTVPGRIMELSLIQSRNAVESQKP